MKLGPILAAIISSERSAIHSVDIDDYLSDYSMRRRGR